MSHPVPVDLSASKPALEARGIDPQQFLVARQTIWPGASPEGVIMAWDYCKARNLDPLKKPVHIVPVWNSGLRKMVEAIWPGIAELRTTAHRTGTFAGNDECVFGPDEVLTFDDGSKKTVPQWAQMTVYRMVKGQRVAFVGPKCYWAETYATAGKSDKPNAMWSRRKVGQIEKCAEAAALRRAFPEELGGIYAAEEMEGQTIDMGAVEVPEPDRPRPTRGEQWLQATAKAVTEANGNDDANSTSDTAQGEAITADSAIPESAPDLDALRAYYGQMKAVYAACQEEADVEATREQVIVELEKRRAPDEQRQHFATLYLEAIKRVRG